MSQSLSKIYVHLVFSTKGRADILPIKHSAEIHAYVAQVLNDNHCPAICVGGTANHIHILFIQSKTMTLSDIVRLVKSNSSKWINGRSSSLIPFSWQDGYGAFSISQSHVSEVKRYIESQEEHHKNVSFQNEFRRLCLLFDVEYNEKFVWD